MSATKKQTLRLIFLGVGLELFSLSVASAATRYVDSAATGSNNGTSWANAWTSISSATGAGVSAGDIVYISGGASGGGGKTYSGFDPKSGTSGNPITYQIGQEAGHNGVATFSGSGTWLSGKSYVQIIGDAGDGQRHFALSGYSKVMSGTFTGMRLAYVNCGTVAGSGTGTRAFDFNGSAVEVDHLYLKHDNTDINSDNLMLFGSSGGASYDSGIKLHHNEFLTWTKSDGGPDIFRCAGNGISVYNNLFYTFAKANSGTPEHQDGMQNWEGGHQYYKVYNNVIMDLKNAGVVISAYYGGYQHMRMYNNLIVFTDSTASGSCQGGSIAINSGYVGSQPCLMTDCVVANNLICGGAQSWNLHSVGYTGSSTWTGSIIANNISVQGANISWNAAVTATNNINNMSAGTAGSYFQSFVTKLNGTNNNFRLTASATDLIGQGMNLTSYGITTDFDGNARPASGNWDIGPFQYVKTTSPGTNSAISVSPTSLNYGPVTTNTTANLSCIVSNAGGGTLVGVASVAAPFAIVSSANYNLGPGQSQAVTVSFSPLSTGTASGTITFTGGGGASTAVTGQGINSTTSSERPTFAVEDGNWTSPFALADGYLSQSVETGVTDGGQVIFNFSITNAGDYVVRAVVNAPSASANSLFVNIDAQPQDPAMIWDVTPTSGFEERLVSWRGTGDDGNNEFTPVRFNLAVGAHQLVIRGREANVQLRSVTLARTPAKPLQLRFVTNP